MLCARCGVEVLESRNAGWVHIDAVPQGVTEHNVDPIDVTAFGEVREHRASLREAASDLLQHHATMHPASDCEWVARLRAALKS